MDGRSYKIDVVWLFALAASAVFAYFLARQNWLPAIALAGVIAILLVGLSRPLLLTTVWIVGPPTVFVFVDHRLESIPGVTVDRALFLFIAALLVARLMLRPVDFKRPGAVELAMAAYFLIVLVSWLTTIPAKQEQALKTDIYLLVHAFVMPFTAYFIARNTNWTPQLVRNFLWALILVGLFQAGAGVLEHFFDYLIVPAPKDSLGHPGRMTGTFFNSGTFGLVQSIVFFAALFLCAQTKEPAGRTLLGIIALVLLACILFAKGRAVWLAIVLCLPFVALRSPRIRPLVIGAALVGGLLALVLLPFVASSEDFGARLKDSASVYNRVALYATSIGMILDRPLFGFGFGSSTFNLNKDDYYDTFGNIPADYASWPTVPHNEILHVLVLTGVVGGIAYLSLLFVLVRLLWRYGSRMRESDPFFGDLSDCVLAAFAVVLINQLFLDLMFTPILLVMIFFLIGIVASRADTVRAPPRGAARAAQPPLAQRTGQ